MIEFLLLMFNTYMMSLKGYVSGMDIVSWVLTRNIPSEMSTWYRYSPGAHFSKVKKPIKNPVMAAVVLMAVGLWRTWGRGGRSGE